MTKRNDCVRQEDRLYAQTTTTGNQCLIKIPLDKRRDLNLGHCLKHHTDFRDHACVYFNTDWRVSEVIIFSTRQP